MDFSCLNSYLGLQNKKLVVASLHRELIGTLSIAIDFAFYSYLVAQDCKDNGSGASGLYWYGLDISSAFTRAKPNNITHTLITFLKFTENMNVLYSWQNTLPGI